jgi:glycolate oxidase FAD binding subunit
MTDLAQPLAARVEAAYLAKTPLNICGAGTKSFLGRIAPQDETLDVTGHSGIIEYDPAELVLVARAGTTLKEVNAALADNHQMLGFEPPYADAGATLGGAVAAGLAGPRRSYTGAVRDFVLGACFINGKGEIIRAGGKVFKNVAGFDLFRPMARSMGTLGVLLDISLRVLPKPDLEHTVIHEEKDEHTALSKMNRWTGKTQAISAAAWDGHNIRIRLSGSAASIEDGWKQMGGEILEEDIYWQDLNKFNLKFFKQQGRLWRVSVAPMSGPIGEDMQQLVDWGGAQRWLKGNQSAETVRSRASRYGGHAECFSDDQTIPTYHPLDAPLLAANQRFKAALDPAGILNPGRFW